MDTIYENLSYCASLHQDEVAEQDYDMDEDDYYDDVNDHEGLYADADIQGGYIPKSSSATAIGHAEASDDTVVDQVPAIDLQSGEWYTGNPESDAKFQLSEQGQVMLQQWNERTSAKRQQEGNGTPSASSGKRGREEGQDSNMDLAEQDLSTGIIGSSENNSQNPEAFTEESHQEGRSKMWRVY